MLKSYSETNIGRKRQLNQDYVFSSGKPIGNMPNLFIVADGMGGHRKGEVASALTVPHLGKRFQESASVGTKIAFKFLDKVDLPDPL